LVETKAGEKWTGRSAPKAKQLLARGRWAKGPVTANCSALSLRTVRAAIAGAPKSGSAAASPLPLLLKTTPSSPNPNSMPAPLPGDMRAHTGAHTLGHAFLHVKIRTTQRCGPPPMRHHLSDLIYRPLMVCQEKSAKNSVFFRTKIVKEANGTIKIPLLDYSCRNTTVVCFTYSR